MSDADHADGLALSLATSLAYQIANAQTEIDQNPFVASEEEGTIPVSYEEIKKWRSEGSVNGSDTDVRFTEKGRKYLASLDGVIERLFEAGSDSQFYWSIAFYKEDGRPVNILPALRAAKGFEWDELMKGIDRPFLLSLFASSSLRSDEYSRVPSAIAFHWEADKSTSVAGGEEELYVPRLEARTNGRTFNSDAIASVETSFLPDEADEWWEEFLRQEYYKLLKGDKGLELNAEGQLEVCLYFSVIAVGLGLCDTEEAIIESDRLDAAVNSEELHAYAFPLLVPPPSVRIRKHLTTASLAVLFIATDSRLESNRGSLAKAQLAAQTLAPIAARRLQIVVERMVDRARISTLAHEIGQVATSLNNIVHDAEFARASIDDRELLLATSDGLEELNQGETTLTDNSEIDHVKKLKIIRSYELYKGGYDFINLVSSETPGAIDELETGSPASELIDKAIAKACDIILLKWWFIQTGGRRKKKMKEKRLSPSEIEEYIGRFKKRVTDEVFSANPAVARLRIGPLNRDALVYIFRAMLAAIHNALYHAILDKGQFEQWSIGRCFVGLSKGDFAVSNHFEEELQGAENGTKAVVQSHLANLPEVLNGDEDYNPETAFTSDDFTEIDDHSILTEEERDWLLPDSARSDIRIWRSTFRLPSQFLTE